MDIASLLGKPPADFVHLLGAEGIRRFHFVYDAETSRMIASHPLLQPLAEFVGADRRDFMEHEGLFFQVSRRHETLQGAFVHRTCRGQAAGGVRYWPYDSLEDYLRDGLRLAKGMTRKNALAGLWWGGGKGVMARNPALPREDSQARRELYAEYGELMTAIRGCYVTAEDVGTHETDMAAVFSRTRFTTCIPRELGGSGNPSLPTARGVIAGMEAGLEFLRLGGLHEKTVAVQGMGNVGGPLIGLLLEKGVRRVLACDIEVGLAERVAADCGGDRLEVRIAERGDEAFLAASCEVLAPCATGAVLNPRSIPELRCRLICGAANNQLEDAERDDRALCDRGITYVPDFLTNRMGIVNCANEQAGHITGDPLIERHLSRDWEFSIHRMSLKVLEESRNSGTAPGRTALRMADELSLKEHPLFGHRGRRIIHSLAENRWFESRRSPGVSQEVQ